MNRSSVPKLLIVGLLGTLAACQSGATPRTSIAAPPAATSSAKPLGEHVIAEWAVSSPADIYIGSGSVWVPEHGSGKTLRIDPASNMIVEVVPTEARDAEGFGSLWTATQDNKLNRVDPATRQVIASIPLDDGSLDILNGVVVTPAAVWVLQSDNAELIRVDPATNRVVSKTSWATLIDDATAQTGIPSGTGADFMWLQIAGDEGRGFQKGLLRLDPNSGAGLTFLAWNPDHVGDGPITVTDEAVWHSAGGHIYRINVATNQIDATYTTAPGIIHLAIGFGSVWLANYERSLAQRLDVAP